MRIVSLLPSATEIVCCPRAGRRARRRHPRVRLAAGDRRHAGHDAAASSTSRRRAARDIHRLVSDAVHGGSSLYALDEEALEAAQPDLILTQELCQVCAVSYREVNEVARAIDADITVVSLEPTSIEGIFNTISTVGAMTDAEDEAVELVESLRTRLGIVETRVHERRKDGHEAPRVVGLEWLDPPFAVGHWVPEQIRRAGGWDLLGQDGEASRRDRLAMRSSTSTPRCSCSCRAASTWPRPSPSGSGRRGRSAGSRSRRSAAATSSRVDGSAYFSRPGPAGPRRDRDARRDLRSRRVRRDVAAGQLDAARARWPQPVAGPRATFDCLWCGPSVDDALARRPRGLGPALPGLPRPGRRQPVPPVPAAGRADGARGSVAAPATRRRTPPSRPAEPAPAPDRDAEMLAYYEARAGEYDDWYLRRGRYARGPIHDAAWNAELDGAGTWLDAPADPAARSSSSPRAPAGGRRSSRRRASCRSTTPPRRRSSAPASGSSPTASAPTSTSATRGPSRTARSTRSFCGFWLSHVARARTGDFLALARRWLKPGGIFAFIDSLPDPQSGAADHPDPTATTWRSAGSTTAASSRSSRSTASRPSSRRRSAPPASTSVRVTTTGRFFVLGEARA